MNTDTGHLVSAEEFERLKREGKAAGYVPIPKTLETVAREVLGTAKGVMIPKADHRTAIGKWAARHRVPEKRRRYLEKKRRIQEGNRRAGNVRRPGDTE